MLVVDDDSPDGTTRIVDGLAANDPRIRGIRRVSQRGFGSATLAGLRLGLEQGYDAILTLDGDFSHDPSDLPRLIEALATVDVAIGSRYARGGRVLNWNAGRLLLSRVANAYVRALTGLPCRDCTSGFRGYRTTALRSVNLSRIRTTGYAFLLHLLFELAPASVLEVPICFTERRLGRSKMSKGVIAEALLWPPLLLLQRVRRGRRKSPVACPPDEPAAGSQITR